MTMDEMTDVSDQFEEICNWMKENQVVAETLFNEAILEAEERGEQRGHRKGQDEMRERAASTAFYYKYGAASEAIRALPLEGEKPRGAE